MSIRKHFETFICLVCVMVVAGLEGAAVPVKTLSTGVEIPAGGVPTWDGRMQYTTRTEKRPDVAALLGGPTSVPAADGTEPVPPKSAENRYLKWKWRMNLADPKTGLDNAELIAGMK